MRRVLFVDDEQQILDSLRNLLRKQRGEWDMVFALGGEAGIAELERGLFDVVVADMRMPRMDGVALLRRVKELQPGSVRIVLSGQAGNEAVQSVLPVAHQFLSKPCEGARLRSVIGRACGLAELLHSDALARIVGEVDRLPSVPHIHAELSRVAADPFGTSEELAAVIEQDPAMAAKFLQLANSSFFGLPRTETSLQGAARHLGVDLLKALVLTARVIVSAEAKPVAPGFSLLAVQQHSLLAARMARRFLPDEPQRSAAFAAALLHDVGKILLAVGMPGRFGEILQTSREKNVPTHVVEKELLGVTHAEVGAHLLGLWGLPLEIVDAVAHHHHPERAVGPTDTLAAVHVANAFSQEAPPSSTIPELDLGFVESAGFLEDLSRWREIAEEERRAAGALARRPEQTARGE